MKIDEKVFFGQTHKLQKIQFPVFANPSLSQPHEHQ